MTRSPAQNMVDGLMNDALQKVYGDLDYMILREEYTQYDVARALEDGWDLGDHYQEYLDENSEE